MEISKIAETYKGMEGDSSLKVLRHFYAVKHYQKNIKNDASIDSMALAEGRKYKFKNPYYSISFLKSSRSLKKELEHSDSITITQKNLLLFYYGFRQGIFRDKQTIVNGKNVQIHKKVHVVLNGSQESD